MTYPILAASIIGITLTLDLIVLKTMTLKNPTAWLVFVTMCALTICFDGLLVRLPIVTYVQSSIWGVRIAGIPIEDFSYTFAATFVPLATKAYLS